MSQGVRLNNMLFNHGPGSILETIHGPVMVKNWRYVFQNLQNLSKGTQTSTDFLNKFEITEPRLARQLMTSPVDKVSFHSLPSGESLGFRGNPPFVESADFPRFMLCLKGHNHPNSSILFEMGKNEKCPVCGSDEKTSPIRFVGACSAGHLSEIPWSQMIDHKGKSCKPIFNWTETSTSISGIRIQCRDCNASTTLDQGRNRIGACSGEDLSDTVPVHAENCNRSLELTLRSSTNLWQSNTRTAVTIPEDEIEICLKAMKKILPPALPFEKQQVATHLRPNPAMVGSSPTIPTTDILTGSIADVPFPEGQGRFDAKDTAGWILVQILEYFKTQGGADYTRFIAPIRVKVDSGQISTQKFYERWDEFTNPTPLSTVEATRREYSALFETKKNEEHLWPENAGVTLYKKSKPVVPNGGGVFSFGVGGKAIEFRIHEVSKLRTVTALQSFTRPVRDRFNKLNRPVPVDLAHRDQYDNRWYGAAEAQGEGILITLAEGSNLTIGDSRWDAWEQQHSGLVLSSNVGKKQFMHHALRGKDLAAGHTVQDGEVVEIHPMFVWWHSLAHQLIRAIQHDTGYSSSAITERIYTVKNDDGSWSGGLLLYVTEGGMDGTLGGLTALAPNMHRYLDDVARMSEICSNDPLCTQTTSSSLPEDRGCYSCSYNSETSCKHFNLSLDRLLLRECVGLP